MSTVLSPAPVAAPVVADNAGSIRDSGRLQALRTVLLAGGAAATLDLIFAFTFYGVTVGASPIRILHSIASGAFGMAAFDGGIATAVFGLVAHYFILIVAAGLYFASCERVHALRRHVVAGGTLFGIAIYCVMHYIVVPLSAAPKFRSTPLSSASEFLMHLLLGLTIALIVRATTRVSTDSGPR